MEKNENQTIISEIQKDINKRENYIAILDTNIFYHLSVQNGLDEKIEKIKKDGSIFITRRILKEINNHIDKDKFEKYCRERYDKKRHFKLNKENFDIDIENECNNFFHNSKTINISAIFDFVNLVMQKQDNIFKKNIEQVKQLVNFFEKNCTTHDYFDTGKLMDIEKEYNFRIKDGEVILGCKDFKTDTLSCSDYIIFKELIEISKEKKKDILYVTEDKKEIKEDKNRKKIQKDFHCKTEQNIYFFDINNFMQFLNIKLTKEEEEINRSISRDMNNSKEILNNLVSQTLLNYTNLQNLPFYKDLNRFAETYKHININFPQLSVMKKIFLHERKKYKMFDREYQKIKNCMLNADILKYAFKNNSLSKNN